MAEEIILNVKPREVVGKQVRALRRDGWIPLSVYGAHTAPANMQVEERALRLVLAKAGHNRLIRLEMRLRLATILPGDLKDQILRLTPDQLIGLRFACDSELPDLVRRVLKGELTERKAIKKAVRTWEPDLFRA